MRFARPVSAAALHPVLWMNCVPLCGYVHVLCVCSSAGGRLGCLSLCLRRTALSGRTLPACPPRGLVALSEGRVDGTKPWLCRQPMTVRSPTCNFSSGQGGLRPGPWSRTTRAASAQGGGGVGSEAVKQMSQPAPPPGGRSPLSALWSQGTNPPWHCVVTGAQFPLNSGHLRSRRPWVGKREKTFSRALQRGLGLLGTNPPGERGPGGAA